MLISLLATILVIGLLVWLVQMLPIPDPFKSIAIAVVVLKEADAATGKRQVRLAS